MNDRAVITILKSMQRNLECIISSINKNDYEYAMLNIGSLYQYVKSTRQLIENGAWHFMVKQNEEAEKEQKDSAYNDIESEFKEKLESLLKDILTSLHK